MPDPQNLLYASTNAVQHDAGTGEDGISRSTCCKKKRKKFQLKLVKKMIT